MSDSSENSPSPSGCLVVENENKNESESENENENENENGVLFVLFRYSLALLIPLVLFFCVSFSLGFLAFLVHSFSIPSPVSLPAQCKIVSSSVDIRSSKVCELGLLNYNAKNVFNPSEKRKFRCRYDYYWASVFKVEYRDHLSGQTRHALVEAPNEALPIDCRPGFGTAWLTKDKFKVNETYDCWYSSGVSKVRIYHDDLFSCQAKDPSSFEMIRRYYILFTKLLHSWLISRDSPLFLRWETIAGLVTGFSTSVMSIAVIKVIQRARSWPQFCMTRLLSCGIKAYHFKRACFFLVYITVTGWLVTEYGKRLGLPVAYLYK